MELKDILIKSKDILTIIKKNNADDIKLFGSFANGTSHENSDVDFIIHFRENASLFDLIEIKIELEDLLDRKVDIVSENSLTLNEISNTIKRSAIQI